VISKGRTETGKKRESRLEAEPPSPSSYREDYRFARDQHLIFWFWSDGRTDGRTNGRTNGRTRLDRTVPTRRLIDRFENLGDHLCWSIYRRSCPDLSLPRQSLLSNSQEYNKFLLRLTIPSSLVLVRSSETAFPSSLSLSLSLSSLLASLFSFYTHSIGFDPQSIIVGGREKERRAKRTKRRSSRPNIS